MDDLVLICICLLNQKILRELRPIRCTVVLKCLICKPYFSSLNIMTVLVTAYDILSIRIQIQEVKITIACFVIAFKLMTLYLIYQLNSTYPPSKAKDFRLTAVAGYFIT